jgi:hypothetical protein
MIFSWNRVSLPVPSAEEQEKAGEGEEVMSVTEVLLTQYHLMYKHHIYSTDNILTLCSQYASTILTLSSHFNTTYLTSSCTA